ncbi:hypothetical protein ASG88_01720 [Nocardioides sp. Soil777]|uniref:CYTH and CHAD domain-containing protein n=1 Tax=Nocardioides sp. Soil777 TaxID=1736409 RepID=UPI0007038A15|nr:CYTH and CHAD domain-containing protein [Nocardioides sp. Soil777]KRF07576.1 hypothetical protein ASG88_01720 [Nocardioides sp. Soil777]
MDEQREVERKYDVDPDAVVPDLPGAVEPVEHDLVATYYDTPDLRLQAAGITLRRRTGGVDEGWHLKLPGKDDARVEVHAPIGSDVVPPPLLERVRGHLRDVEAVPVARLSTRRSVRRIVEDGVVVAELCDDRVRAEALPVVAGEGLTTDAWREWELELVEGGRAVFGALDPVLRSAGASPATRASKVARILADRLPVDGWRRHSATGATTVGEVCLGYLAAQLDRLLEQDRELRSGRVDEPVHQIRVAARRLRSALATFRPLVTKDAAGTADALREELRWLGSSLGDARDLTVLRGRLDALLRDDDPTTVATRRHVDAVLTDDHRVALADAARVLDDVRYFRLLDGLEEFLTEAPFTSRAERPARRALTSMLRVEVKRFRRRARRVEQAPDEPSQDRALHDVRKAAKRLRYAAEAAAPVLGVGADELAARAEAVQEVLGEHQDTVVSRAALDDLAHHRDATGPVGLGLGRLQQLEAERAAELRAGSAAVIADAASRPGWLRK